MYFFNSFIVCSSYYFGFTIFFFFFTMRTFYKTWQIEEIFCCSFEIRGVGDVNNWEEQEWKCCKITDHEFKVKRKNQNLVYLVPIPNWNTWQQNDINCELVKKSVNDWQFPWISTYILELFVQKESHCTVCLCI